MTENFPLWRAMDRSDSTCVFSCFFKTKMSSEGDFLNSFAQIDKKLEIIRLLGAKLRPFQKTATSVSESV